MRNDHAPSLLARLYRELFGLPVRHVPQRAVDASLAPSARLRQVIKVEPWLAFTPTQPRTGRRQLVGRQREHDRILQALLEERAHVVLYSERGRGKTSLANMVVDSLRRNGQIVARHTCDAESTFDSIVRGLARDLPPALLVRPADNQFAEGVETALPDAELRPRDVVGLLPHLTCRSLVCVVDEFDRLDDQITRTRIADTVKQLSDRGTRLSFMIVGVSENLDQILGQHPSIQRNLVSVQLPLLSDDETCTVIERGIRQANMTFEPWLLAQVPPLVRGNPYMAQLLGLRLTQATAARGGLQAAEPDLAVAIDRLIDEAQPQDTLDYLSLTTNRHDHVMVAALDALAGQEQDRWGYLVAMPDASGDVTLAGRSVAAAPWSRILEAGLLRPVGGGSGIYTFSRRSMMHHILLVTERDRLASSDQNRPLPNLGLIQTDPSAEPPITAARMDRLCLRATHA